MKLNGIGILAFAASAAGISEQLIKNYCSEDIYVTIFSNATDSTNGPFSLPSGQAWMSGIVGTGNTATITKNPDVFQAIPKLWMGTSTYEGILYWSVSNATGDPFQDESFSVLSALENGTEPNVCQNATRYDGQVHACQDTNVTLTLSLC